MHQAYLSDEYPFVGGVDGVSRLLARSPLDADADLLLLVELCDAHLNEPRWLRIVLHVQHDLVRRSDERHDSFLVRRVSDVHSIHCEDTIAQMQVRFRCLAIRYNLGAKQDIKLYYISRYATF